MEQQFTLLWFAGGSTL